jgi:DNA-binding transcriptional MerR regulator
MQSSSTSIFTSTEAAAVSGVPSANLEYWRRIDFLPPSVKRSKTRGGRNLYNFRDVLAARIVRALRDPSSDLKLYQPLVDFIRKREDFDPETIGRARLLVMVGGNTCGGVVTLLPIDGEEEATRAEDLIIFGVGPGGMPPLDETDVRTMHLVNLHVIIAELREKIRELEASETAAAAA